MSLGLSIAIATVPFLEMLEEEAEELSAKVLESGEGPAARAAMDATRRRLAGGIDTFVRSLPASVRNDANTARAAAYALTGLADESMLHRPTGGLERWQDRLLESELYGSALAGQEIVNRARAACSGMAYGGDNQEAVLFAPLFLAIFRSGFEGSLRGDEAALQSVITALEDVVGTGGGQVGELVPEPRPTRAGVAPSSMMILGAVMYLFAGAGIWLSLTSPTLRQADHIAQQIKFGRAIDPEIEADDPFRDSLGPVILGAPSASGE